VRRQIGEQDAAAAHKRSRRFRERPRGHGQVRQHQREDRGVELPIRDWQRLDIAARQLDVRCAGKPPTSRRQHGGRIVHRNTWRQTVR